MTRQICFVVMVVLIGLGINAVQAFVPSEIYSDYQFKELQEDDQGYLTNTSGDSYFILNGLNLSRAELCGLAFSVDFKDKPLRATKFDLFWRTENAGFSESQKTFFIINQEDAGVSNRYFLDLCELYTYSGNLSQPSHQANITGLRFDYPGNKTVALKFNSFTLLDSQASSELASNNEGLIVLEPYETIPARAFRSFDILIPKLIFAFEHGLKRLGQDPAFVIFWLLLILSLSALIIRSYVRQRQSNTLNKRDS